MSESGPVRVAIVDDEPLAREGVRMLLADDDEVEVVGEAGNGGEALALLREARPDIVFLDVEMPEMNGFEILGRLDPGRLPVVVFISAYDDYAMRAFEVHALDYLQKPYRDERFYEALARAKDQLRLSRMSELSGRLMELLESYRKERPDGEGGGERKSLRKIAIKSAGRVTYVDTGDIDWIEAADYYVQLHIGEVSYLHRQTMASLEEQLDSATFCRIHRSAIVNLSRVREVSRGGRREVHVVLEGGIELRVARRHREKLQKLLEARSRG